MRPNLAERVERKQQSQKKLHDSHSREREFSIGAKVWVCNMQRGDKWLPGMILSKEGSVTYHVEMASGRVCKCHTDQLRLRTVQADTHDSLNSPTLPLTATNAPSSIVPDSSPAEPPMDTDSRVVEAVPDSNNHSTKQLPEPSTSLTDAEPVVVVPDNNTVQRRSTRAHKPVDRYEPKW